MKVAAAAEHKNRALDLYLPFAVLAGLALLLVGCSSSNDTKVQTTVSKEQTYQANVKAFVDKFYNHRRDYNTGLVRIGAKVRSARTETEQRQALQEVVSHLEDAHRWFRQDRDDFALQLPPTKFREAHLLMNSALNDYVDATMSFITYYSQNLSLGTQDLYLATRASSLIKTANENLQRAAYMYGDLFGNK